MPSTLALSDLPREPATKMHLEFIDGIRALAALFVMVCHAYFEPANGYYASRLMNHLGLTYGHVAVDVFIVVSGFCLMLPVARRGDELGDIKKFFVRRARRILPPYYAALLLSILFILTTAHALTGTVWDNSLPLTWPQVLAHVFLVHDLPLGLKGGTINYPLWSIAVECQIYLAMPLVVLSLRRIGNAATLAWTIAWGIVLHVAFAGKLDICMPWYLGLFTMGAVAARESLRAPRHFWRPLSYAVWGVLALVILLKGKQFFGTYSCYLDTMAGLATALLMAATIQETHTRLSPLTRFLSWKPLVRIGLFSYSMYLVHAPLLHLNDLILTRLLNPNPVLMFLLLLGTTPLIVAAAYGFHVLFERPFMTSQGPKVPRFRFAAVSPPLVSSGELRPVETKVE